VFYKPKSPPTSTQKLQKTPLQQKYFIKKHVDNPLKIKDNRYKSKTNIHFFCKKMLQKEDKTVSYAIVNQNN